MQDGRRVVTVAHPADTDGINGILGGAHRAGSTGVTRLTELRLARPRSCPRPGRRHRRQARPGSDRGPNGRDHRVRAEEMAGRKVSVADSDDQHCSPACDGPVAGAASRLTDGTHTAVDDVGNIVTVVVAGIQTGAVGDANPSRRVVHSPANILPTGRIHPAGPQPVNPTSTLPSPSSTTEPSLAEKHTPRRDPAASPPLRAAAALVSATVEFGVALAPYIVQPSDCEPAGRFVDAVYWLATAD